MPSWLPTVLLVIVLASIWVSTLIIKNFFPTYVGEKGKNKATKEDIGAITTIVQNAKLEIDKKLEQFKSDQAYYTELSRNRATKQDIEDITAKVEEVKSIYASDLQRIKTVLDTQSHQFIYLYEKRAEAFAKFFEECLLLITKLRTPIFFRLDNIDDLDAYIKEVNELISRSISSEYRVKVYFPPANIIDPADEVTAALYDLHSKWAGYAFAYRKDFVNAIQEAEKGIQNPPENWSSRLNTLLQFNIQSAERIDLKLSEYATGLNGKLNSADPAEFLSNATAAGLDGQKSRVHEDVEVDG
jgi:hypothetical protein